MRSPFLAILLGSVALAATVPPAAARDPLTPYRGRSRVLLVIAPQAGDARVDAQKRIMAETGGGDRERELVVVEASGPSASAAALRKRFSVPAGAFRVILVGKDGEAKMTGDSPIPAALIFEEIDRMPMRQDEIRRNRAGRS